MLITHRMGQRLCWDVMDFTLGLAGMFHMAPVKAGFPSQMCKRTDMDINSYKYGKGDGQIWSFHCNNSGGGGLVAKSCPTL